MHSLVGGWKSHPTHLGWYQRKLIFFRRLNHTPVIIQNWALGRCRRTSCYHRWGMVSGHCVRIVNDRHRQHMHYYIILYIYCIILYVYLIYHVFILPYTYIYTYIHINTFYTIFIYSTCTYMLSYYDVSPYILHIITCFHTFSDVTVYLLLQFAIDIPIYHTMIIKKTRNHQTHGRTWCALSMEHFTCW